MNCRTAVVALVHEHSRVLSGLHRTAIDRPEHDLVAAAGIKPDRVFTDTASGRAGSDRPGWTECMGWLREGDHVVVVAVDRFGRSVREVATALHELTTRRGGHGHPGGARGHQHHGHHRRAGTRTGQRAPGRHSRRNSSGSIDRANQLSELITIFGISRSTLVSDVESAEAGLGRF
jgi:hypothetical protein